MRTATATCDEIVAPGLLFHHPDGRSGCPACGWAGVPTFVAGLRLDACPACEARPDPRRRVEKVSRNAPCPCGSGRKHKRCCPRGS